MGDDCDDESYEDGELVAVAEVLHRIGSVAVSLYAKAANISEPEAWKNVLELAEIGVKPD